jgi:hypothetical protein
MLTQLAECVFCRVNASQTEQDSNLQVSVISRNMNAVYQRRDLKPVRSNVFEGETFPVFVGAREVDDRKGSSAVIHPKFRHVLGLNELRTRVKHVGFYLAL